MPTLQEQLDTTLRLVCWSGVAARFGVQLEMIDALIDAGAAPAGEARERYASIVSYLRDRVSLKN